MIRIESNFKERKYIKCGNCDVLLSFDEDDIQRDEDIEFVECLGCGKRVNVAEWRQGFSNKKVRYRLWSNKIERV